MGKKLIIRGANFINYVDKEGLFTQKTISEFSYISTLGDAIGGMDTIDSPAFGALADPTIQYGMMVPIDIEGITMAKIYNTYGQTSGIHAKVLDVNGNFVIDIMGTSVGFDDEIIVENFPLESKWMFLNTTKSKEARLEMSGYFGDSSKSEIEHAILKENAFIAPNGTIIESTLIEGRSVIQIPVVQGERIFVVGALASSGGQGYNMGSFFDTFDNLLSSIILDTTVTPTNNPTYGIISTIVPDNATTLKCNVNSKGFKVFKIIE